MLANRVISALLLAVFGASGCAAIERWNDLPSAAAPEFSAPAAAAPQPATLASPAADQTIAAETAEGEPRAALAETEPIPPAAPVAAPPSPKEEDAKTKDKRSDLTNGDAPPASLLADNRLLELLDKDLDHAMEQPAEHRRLQFSKAVAGNPMVRHFVDHYSTTARRHFQALLARSGKYLPMISRVLQQEGLPEELGYLALLESEFNVGVKSPSGAVGLWQFVAGTARGYGLRIDEWVDERRDPVKSTRAAAAYLKDLHDRYGRWYLATAAYNAGPGRINRAMKSSGAKDFWSLSEKASLSEETRNFVPKFVAIVLIASDPRSYGFDEIEYAPPLDYEEVELPWPMPLAVLAKWADSDIATLRELNPAILRDTTPPAESGFRVNLPVGHAEVYLARAHEKFGGDNLKPFQILTHKVRKGDTLYAIAKRYGQQVRALMEFNGLTHARLRIGQKIIILLSQMPGVR
jgi:membrane-bound lytic murein transglycosylase D